MFDIIYYQSLIVNYISCILYLILILKNSLKNNNLITDEQIIYSVEILLTSKN